MAQGYNDRLDESLGMRRGKESSMKQSYKDRRDESRGMKDRSMRENVDVMGHASKVYSCDAFAAEKSDLDRVDWLRNGNLGYPEQAWDYRY